MIPRLQKTSIPIYPAKRSFGTGFRTRLTTVDLVKSFSTVILEANGKTMYPS